MGVLAGGWAPGSASARSFEEDEFPKGYPQLAWKLIKALTDTLEFDKDPAVTYAELNRYAQRARPLVREFIGKWNTSGALVNDVSRLEIKEAIQELGDYYEQVGPMAKSTNALRDRVYEHLDRAKQYLPPEPEEKKLFGVF